MKGTLRHSHMWLLLAVSALRVLLTILDTQIMLFIVETVGFYTWCFMLLNTWLLTLDPMGRHGKDFHRFIRRPLLRFLIGSTAIFLAGLVFTRYALDLQMNFFDCHPAPAPTPLPTVTLAPTNATYSLNVTDSSSSASDSCHRAQLSVTTPLPRLRSLTRSRTHVACPVSCDSYILLRRSCHVPCAM